MGSSQRTQHWPAALLRSLLLTLLLSATAAAAASVAKLPPFVEDVAGEIGGALTAAAWLQPPPPAAEGGGGGPELSRVVTGGTPGDFNLFIFAMSWKAEWCYHQNYPGCKKPRSFWENNLTIHGLWPDYGDGTYPTTCTSEPYDHDRVVGAVGLEVLETMWPNIQVPEGHANCHGKGKKYDSFWEHEWTKHGTCTGLSMEDYFITAVSLLQQRFVTPPQLAENVGGHVTRGELEDAYGGDGMAVLDCKGKVHLNQVYLCLEQDPETHLPGAQVACPPAIVAHDDTCGQDDLDVAAFE